MYSHVSVPPLTVPLGLGTFRVMVLCSGPSVFVDGEESLSCVRWCKEVGELAGCWILRWKEGNEFLCNCLKNP